MNHDHDGYQEERADHESHAHALESLERARAGGGHDHKGGDQDARDLRNAQIVEPQADADELRDDRQCIEDEQIDHTERAPELAEALEDEPGMAHAGHDTQAEHHFLVHVEDRHQQKQHPKQAGAIVLAGLGIGSERAGVVVANHDNETWSEDRQQRPDSP